MQEPAGIVGKVMWDKMTLIYRDWVRRDRYVGLRPSAPELMEGQVSSVREMVGHIFRVSARHSAALRGVPTPPRLEMTLGELMELTMQAPPAGHHQPLTKVFKSAFCLYKVPPLFADACIFGRERDEASSDEALASAGCGDWEELWQRVTGESKNRECLALALLPIFLEHSKDRVLWDYFREPLDEHGYRSWEHGVFTSIGRPLKTRSVSTSHGRVDMRVSRYEDETDSGIAAYEWQATLHSTTAEPTAEPVAHRPRPPVPDAAACGMVYVLPCQDGKLLCSASELRWAADAVADIDVAQMVAFLELPDAVERVEAGDLCFLWLWERRDGAPKGGGTALLAAALKDLKKRFGKVRTLVVNLKPSQFVLHVDDFDPPEVHVARQEAAERLEQLLHSIAPERLLGNGAEVRLISPRRMSHEETLKRLAELDGPVDLSGTIASLEQLAELFLKGSDKRSP